jgi:hypothetical protein
VQLGSASRIWRSLMADQAPGKFRHWPVCPNLVLTAMLTAGALVSHTLRPVAVNRATTVLLSSWRRSITAAPAQAARVDREVMMVVKCIFADSFANVLLIENMMPCTKYYRFQAFQTCVPSDDPPNATILAEKLRHLISAASPTSLSTDEGCHTNYLAYFYASRDLICPASS